MDGCIKNGISILLLSLLISCSGGGGSNSSTAPTIISVNPPDTAVGALVADTVSATFSKTIDNNTATVNSFTLTDANGSVSGTVTANGAVVSFQPDVALKYNTSYQATLTTEIADLTNTQLAAQMSWTFNTGRKIHANFGGHSCARRTGGGLKCWGRNSNGELGLGDTNHRGDAAGEMGNSLPVVNLGTGRSVLSVGVGSSHTCALLDDRSVKCWGRNTGGQLGLGDTDDRGDAAGEMGDNLPAVDTGSNASVLELAVGASHVCVRLDDGNIKCWGNNGLGQLGQGDTANRGDNAGDMGDTLPTIDLGTGRTVISIIAGDRYNCAILDNDTVKCWGINTDGDLGLGDTGNRGDGPGEMGDNLPVVDPGTGLTVKELALDEHNCALLNNGQVKCWGYNFNGQLGLGDTATRGDAAGEMGDNLPFVSLGTGRTATVISIGSRHSCAVLDDNSLKCWGLGNNGRLGQGDTVTLGDDPNEMGDMLPTIGLGTGLTILELVAGEGFSCTHLNNGSIKCWGANSAGELGLGDANSRGDNANEMGDMLPAVDLGS